MVVSINRKIYINTLSSLGLQMVVCIISLIVPRYIISFYGSEINGATQSINQFLNYIILLEAGAGGVVATALYKPLINQDKEKITNIIIATEKFFRKLSFIFVVYLIIVAFIFPIFSNGDFDFIYMFSLVIIMGISIIAQYTLGISNRLLLTADQKSYISNIIQIFAVIINAIATIILIKVGAPIHFVKLFVAIVFIIKPIILSLYVKKKYNLNKKEGTPDYKTLSQRWDAFSQHIAYFIHGNTDIVLLTMFQSFSVVSIYSVYFLVTNGLSSFVNCLSIGFRPAVGKEIASNNIDKANKLVNMFEFSSFFIGTSAFTICAFLIVPFVKLYTNGITIINYENYLFGFLISTAAFCTIIRGVYYNVIYAAGHFKQTSISSYIELGLNIGISLALVYPLGLVGVAVGTIISTSYKCVHCIIYLNKNILNRPYANFLKNSLITIISLIINISLYISFKGYISPNSFVEWIIIAIIISCIVGFVNALLNIIFNKKYFLQSIKKYKSKFITRAS